MTTPREPDGPYSRDRGGHDADDATWGRAPAGGWGAAADDDRYGADYDTGYEDDGWDAPARRVEPLYERRPGASPRTGDHGREYGRDDYGRDDYGRDDYGRDDYGPGDHAREDHGRGGHRGGEHGGGPSWAQGSLTGARRTPRTVRTHRRRSPLIPLAVLGVVVAAVLVLGFVTPGWFVTRVFDAGAVQTGVAKILTEDYHTDGVADVRCPERVEVVAGATFTCDATIDGDPVKIPVRVTDAKGGYEVGRPA